jgi:hypothetical protein
MTATKSIPICSNKGSVQLLGPNSELNIKLKHYTTEEDVLNANFFGSTCQNNYNKEENHFRMMKGLDV